MLCPAKFGDNMLGLPALTRDIIAVPDKGEPAYQRKKFRGKKQKAA